jgi:hypothetical protein
MRTSMLVMAAVGAVSASSASAIVVGVGTSAAPWQGYMNVSELPSNGGAFVFGSPWGVPDLRATFDDPNNRVALSPNTVNDPSPFWYVGGGAPGSPGNKFMEANLYIETTDVLNGQTVTFQGNVISSSLTNAHQAFVFIKDFAPDYSSVVQTIVPLGPGPFSINLNTDPGLGRHVQYGFQLRGENVWVTDVAPFGNIQIGTIPAPASAGLLAVVGLFAARRRRA